ncbi:MAG: Crp/Fnr family transcriptional regulator [Pyrinomonadaceae bacterium]
MENELGKPDAYTRSQSHTAGHPHTLTALPVGLDAQRTDSDALNLLLTNRLLSALPAEDFSHLFPHLEPVSLVAGQMLYKLDEEIRYVYFPETAVVSHLYILMEGGVTEADMVGREGMAGLSAVFNGPPPAYRSEVTLGGSALRARADVMRQEFARGGALQQILLKYATARITLLSRRAVCNGNHRVDERLCTWLLMMHDRAGDKPLMLTHERISRHLGTRRAGVTSAATALRDRGVIDYTRGHIVVTDRVALEAAACECYPAVRESSYIAR